jgi:peptidylprolyl isomerase
MKINLATQKLLSLITKMKGKRAIARLLPIIVVLAVVIIAVSVWAFSGTTGAQIGDTVRVDYTGTFDNGSIFDSSVNESFGHVEPLEFTIGAGEMIPGFEQAVIGMMVNESKTVHIPMEEAYGPYYEELIMTLNWSQFPEGFETDIGAEIPLQNAYNQTVWATVINVSEAGVTVDANHPLAGEDLNFNITLVEIL